MFVGPSGSPCLWWGEFDFGDVGLNREVVTRSPSDSYKSSQRSFCTPTWRLPVKGRVTPAGRPVLRSVEWVSGRGARWWWAKPGVCLSCRSVTLYLVRRPLSTTWVSDSNLKISTLLVWRTRKFLVFDTQNLLQTSFCKRYNWSCYVVYKTWKVGNFIGVEERSRFPVVPGTFRLTDRNPLFGGVRVRGESRVGPTGVSSVSRWGTLYTRDTVVERKYIPMSTLKYQWTPKKFFTDVR